MALELRSKERSVGKDGKRKVEGREYGKKLRGEEEPISIHGEKRKGEERDKGKQMRRVTQVTVVHLTSEVGQGLQKTVSQPLFPDIFKGKGMNGEPQTDYS